MELNDEMLEELYEWIDKIPLSRPKKRIERDFADGYCVGEIIRQFLPQFIEMHNLTPANNLQQKLANWGLLNSKVFNRFGLNVPYNITQNICNQRPGYIEVFLYNLRYKIEEKLNELERGSRAKMSPRGSLHHIHHHGGISGSFSPYAMSGGSVTNRNNKHAPVVTNEIRLEYEQKVRVNNQYVGCDMLLNLFEFLGSRVPTTSRTNRSTPS